MVLPSMLLPSSVRRRVSAAPTSSGYAEFMKPIPLTYADLGHARVAVLRHAATVAA
jgi:hypothetical protein